MIPTHSSQVRRNPLSAKGWIVVGLVAFFALYGLFADLTAPSAAPSPPAATVASTVAQPTQADADRITAAIQADPYVGKYVLLSYYDPAGALRVGTALATRVGNGTVATDICLAAKSAGGVAVYVLALDGTELAGTGFISGCKAKIG